MATTDKEYINIIRSKSRNLGETFHAKRKRLLGKHYRKIQDARRSRRVAALAALAASSKGAGIQPSKAEDVGSEGNAT